MPYKLTYTLNREFLEVDLRVRIVPEGELQEALARWGEVAALCRTHGLTRILVFMEFIGHHPMEVKFQLARGAADIGWTPDLKMAVVIPNEAQFSEQLFIETAMNSLGYEIKLFLKRRPAKKWLLADL